MFQLTTSKEFEFVKALMLIKGKPVTLSDLQILASQKHNLNVDEFTNVISRMYTSTAVKFLSDDFQNLIIAEELIENYSYFKKYRETKLKERNLFYLPVNEQEILEILNITK